MELMHFIAFLCMSVSGWILFYRGESGKSQVCSRLQPIFLPVFSGCIYPTSLSIKWKFVGWTAAKPYISLHNGFTFWIILYSVGFFSTGFGCLPWHFPDLSPSKATCPRTVPFRSSFLFYSGPGWKERFFYHFIKTYSAVLSLLALLQRTAYRFIPLQSNCVDTCWYRTLKKTMQTGTL